MTKQNNKTCIICKKQYHYCPTCGADAGKPSWYFIFDSENCNEIYETCVAYRDKVIDIKEAYERISKLDVSGLEDFAPSTKAQIEEILNYKAPISEDKQPLENKQPNNEMKSAKNNNTKYKR